MTDTEAAAVALVENLQRQDLNAIDEAEGYDRLLTQFGFTQEALGQAVGKSRSHIANTLRLLNLPPAVKEAVQRGEISAGHARALLAHPAPEAGAARGDRSPVVGPPDRGPGRHASRPRNAPGRMTCCAVAAPDTVALEHRLSEQLGLTVKVTFNGRRGVIQFHYSDLDQLDNLLNKLGLHQ